MFDFSQLPTVNLELIGAVPMYTGMGIKILTAIVLGGLIGADREKKSKAAGIKTNILICIGATLYTAISFLNFEEGSSMNFDPNRMAAQVVSGIGFLGAGAILQTKRRVLGLTTAATIWVVAAVGVAIGSGFPLSATIFTLTTIGVLKILNPIYRIFGLSQGYHLRIECDLGSRDVIETFLENNDVDVSARKIFEAKDSIELHYYFKLNPKEFTWLLQSISTFKGVKKVDYSPVKHISLETS